MKEKESTKRNVQRLGTLKVKGKAITAIINIEWIQGKKLWEKYWAIGRRISENVRKVYEENIEEQTFYYNLGNLLQEVVHPYLVKSRQLKVLW